MSGAKIPFVLASASPARAKVLRGAGIDPVITPAEVDEDRILAEAEAGVGAGSPIGPEEAVSLLATAKAQVVANAGPDLEGDLALVVGCDSMLEFEGELLGKPHRPEVAFERIKAMQGKDATLWTGHHLVLLERAGAGEGTPAGWRLAGEATGAAATVVHFGTMTDAEIRAYVATGEPLEVAGSFTIDGLGGPFLTGVTGDPHSVVGISLPLVRNLAAELGIFWPDLWTSPSS